MYSTVSKGKVYKICGPLSFFNTGLFHKANVQMQKRKGKIPPRKIFVNNYLKFVLFIFSVKIVHLLETEVLNIYALLFWNFSKTPQNTRKLCRMLQKFKTSESQVTWTCFFFLINHACCF